MKLHSTLGLAAVVMSVAVGCGILTAEDAAREILPSYCEKIQECQPELFELAYPGGVDACVEKGLSGISDEDKGRRSACGSAEVDTCKSDIEALECEGFTLDTSGLPDSCQEC